MKNIFRHSHAFVEKHKRHHHLIIVLLVILVAGAGGVSLYKKFASAMTYTFTQSVANGGWATLSTTATSSHSVNGDSALPFTPWTKYYSATNATASAGGVSLSVAPYYATDASTFSTTGSATGGGFSNGTNSSTAINGSSIILADTGTGADGVCNFTGGTINTDTKATYNCTSVNITGTNTATGSSPLTIKATGAVAVTGTLSLDGGVPYCLGWDGYGSCTAYAGGAGGAGGGAGGNSNANGSGTGAGTATSSLYPGTSSCYGSGGGFGGLGGPNPTANASPTSGLTYNTLNAGGSGGGGGGCFGGAGGGGGGSLKIVAGQITVNAGGIIRANGGAGDGGGGGGSGGGILLNAGTFTNNGTVTAHGGAGGTGGAGAGGGGGGRIAIVYGSGTIGTVVANGGYSITSVTNDSANWSGGAGSIIAVSNDTGTGADGVCNFTGGTINTNTKATYNCTSVNITGTNTATGSSPLTIKATGAVTVTGTLSLDGSASAGATGGAAGAGGSSGGNSGLNGNGLGGGVPGGCSGGAGGGYGGRGGASAFGCGGQGFGGVTYNTLDAGGSGASGGSGAGGSGGGGSLKITANQITVNAGGIIRANGGGSSGGYVAGGSGGGIILNAGTFNNNGTVTANGGSGGEWAGSGGGGRIAIIYGSGSVGAVTATAGTGATSARQGQTVVAALASRAYPSSGTFTSAAIGLGGSASFTGKTLAWTETLLSGTDIQIQMRSASTEGGLTGATWYGPTGTGDWYTASGGSINTVHNGAQWVQYKATLAGDTISTPTLNSVTINYDQLSLSGDLVSSKFDSESSGNLVNRVTWVASGTSADETVRFQVRTAASEAGLDGATWCGPTNCTGSYFTSSGETVSNSTLTDGVNDQWFQYKVLLGSGGAATPTLTSVVVQYVVNGPPTVTITTPTVSQASDGTVTVAYDVADADTVSPPLPYAGKVDITLQYCTTNCTTGQEVWADATAVSGTGAGAGVTLGTGKNIVWTPATDYVSQYKSAQKIRVKAYDGEGANNTAYGTSNTFILDTTVPEITTFNVAASSTPGTVNLTITDPSSPEYRLCDDAGYTTGCTSWTSITTATPTPVSKTLANNANGRPEVYLQVRDAYGNTNSGSVTVPATPASFLAADVSNPTANSFGETLSWMTSAGATGGYKVWYATTTAETDPQPSTYTFLANSASNVYTHNITTATTSAHWYRVTAVSTTGDISNLSAAMTKGDIPDSFGTAATDTTAPTISSISAPENLRRSTSAVVTFTTNELASATVIYGTAYSASCSYGSTVSTTHYVTAQSVSVTGLTAGTTYYFCVKATDVLGNVSNANDATLYGGTFATAGGPTISSVSQQDLAGNSVTILWNTATTSDSYVAYSTNNTLTNPIIKGSSDMATCASQGICQHQVGLTGLTAGTDYWYKVTSTDPDGNTVVDTNSGSYHYFKTLQDTTPPTITGTSTPVLSSTAVVVVWQTDEPATSKIDYGTASGTYTKGTAEDPTLSIYHIGTLSSATDNSGSGGGKNALTPETAYYYRVTSKDAAGNSASSEGTFTTPADGNVTIVMVARRSGDEKDTTAPSISNMKIADITAFGATVSFDTDEDTVGFADYGKDASYGSSVGDKTWARTHTMKLRGLTLGTEYHIKVSAVDKAGNTGTGSDQTFKTSFLSENLKDLTKVENIEQYQKELEDTIASILPSLIPPFIAKPQITDITENSATVSFKTNVKAFPVVKYTEDNDYDAAKDDPYTGEISDTTAKAVSHTLALINLKPNTKYHIQARAFSLPQVIGKSEDLTFTTKASKIQGSVVERKRDSFTVVWITDEPTSSIVEYKNLKSGITERKTDNTMASSHSMKIENLPSATSYEVTISGLNAEGNLVEGGSPLSVTTSKDVTPPALSGFKVSNAMVPGRTDRIQTIISWETDEPADSTVYYEEGIGTAGEEAKELMNKVESLDAYVIDHNLIVSSLKPGTIYRIKVASRDDSGNLGAFGPRTIITPKQTESITDIIFKNFEDSFKFLRQM